MRKEKLYTIRKQKGYTQQQIADVIANDVSNYSRKESGDVKIIHDEWKKIASFLQVSMTEIYEDDILKPCNNCIEAQNDDFYKGIIQDLREYITFLKEENMILKEEIKKIPPNSGE